MAFIIPETGEYAFERTFVAVRAIAPVAGMPAKHAQAMLANPSPISSAFGLCVSPVIASATVALSNDSTPAKKAIVRALGKTLKANYKLKSGRLGAGKKWGSAPNCEPMVATSNGKITTNKVATHTAIK